jgi:phage baseplate assembly protein W
MSTEIMAPFQLAPDGGVAVTVSAIAQTQQHIEALVATGPGERVILTSYGVPTRNAVFAPNNQVIAQILQTSVASAMETWEPSVQVNSISATAQTGSPANSAAITINWSPKQVSNTLQPGIYSSTILVGGDVV